MKTVAAQRVVPLRASKAARPQKKVRLHTELDVRRQKALKVQWDHQKALGRQLSPMRVGKKKGLESGSMASQCLHGYAALNVHWMLCFAEELGMVPQQIWGDDWPFPNMTPAYMPPGFERLMRQLERLMRAYASLGTSAQAQIVGILEAEKQR